MTDRIKGFTVALTHDIREDDCQQIIDAIRMIKGVSNVTTHVADPFDHMMRQSIKLELLDSMTLLLLPKNLT